MKLFNSTFESFSAAFQRDNYILAKCVVTADFLEYARAQLKRCRSYGYNELAAREIKSKKKQYLFDLPDGDDILDELVSSISELTGIPTDKMNVSERHVMIYDEHAAPHPPLHKDRLASRFSVGIPLEASQEARIALLANGPRDRNLLDRAIYCDTQASTTSGPSSLSVDGDVPAHLDSSIIALDAQPGDAVIFAGSSIFHGRLNAARTSILYFKLSDLGLDPLCEDPATLQQRRTSIEILRRAGTTDNLLEHSSLELSPRLQNLNRVYSRSDWTNVLRVTISGEGDFTISDQELDLLLRIQGRIKVRDILHAHDSTARHLELLSVWRLVELGALDLLA